MMQTSKLWNYSHPFRHTNLLMLSGKHIYILYQNLFLFFMQISFFYKSIVCQDAIFPPLLPRACTLTYLMASIVCLHTLAHPSTCIHTTLLQLLWRCPQVQGINNGWDMIDKKTEIGGMARWLFWSVSLALF